MSKKLHNVYLFLLGKQEQHSEIFQINNANVSVVSLSTNDKMKFLRRFESRIQKNIILNETKRQQFRLYD